MVELVPLTEFLFQTTYVSLILYISDLMRVGLSNFQVTLSAVNKDVI